MREQLEGKTAAERATLKSQEIARVARKRSHNRDSLRIEIVDLNAIDGGVEVFVRAFRNGNQLGFGKDGSVDIERFRIFNPPILVPDENGEIVREWTDEDGEMHSRRLREDAEEAILQVIEHNLSIMKNVHDAKRIKKGKRGNTTSTFYPDPNPETATVDGRIAYETAGAWATAHDAATGTVADDASAGPLAIGTRYRTSSVRYDVFRAVFYFNTGTIPSSDEITSATFSLYAGSITNNENDGSDFINIVQVKGDQVSSDTGVTTSDFDLVGDAIDNPTEGATRIDLGSMSAGAYTNFILNASGISWIARSGEEKPSGATPGITYLGAREGHDILDETPDTVNGNFMSVYFADQTGTANDPKLVVEHEAGATFIPRVTFF